MNERGILFTPENYTKCENGTTTQTRRIAKVPPDITQVQRGPNIGWWYWKDNRQTIPITIRCPFGTVGDRLYVKEGLEKRTGNYVQYRRDKKHLSPYGWQWQRPTLSPLHMPKWAARLWLEITEVRVERLNSISELDCEAEVGAAPHSLGDGAYQAFKILWESNKIHKPGSWELNPWVWVISYRKEAV